MAALESFRALRQHHPHTKLNTLEPELDRTDRHLIAHLRHSPRASVAELARTLDVARGTVHTRLARLEARGVITGFGPDIDPRAAGYDVLAFTTLSIAQGSHQSTVAALATIDEVTEVHTVTGAGDLLVRITARSNDHLHDVVQAIAAIAQVGRTETQLALATPLARTAADLIAATLEEQ